MTTNQRQPESSQAILERIRQKLGITAEVAQESQQNVVQMQQRQQQSQQPIARQQPQQERVQQNYQPQEKQNVQQTQGNFDDNFSFNDMEFNPQAQQDQERNEINHLLRSYQNNRKNSYVQQETQQNQEWNEESEFEDFESELEQTEFDLNEQEEDEFEQEEGEYEQEEDEFEQEEENEFEQGEFAEFEDEIEQGNSNNVHFLSRSQAQQPQQQVQNQEQQNQELAQQEQGRAARQQYFNLSQGQQASQSSSLDMYVKNAIVQWCEENLESVCREVIREELRKTA